MKRDINTETPLIPYIIAERAAWNVLEKDKRFKDATHKQLHEIVADLSPVLVLRAEKTYSTNGHFRRQLLDKRKDCRYTLEMFMEHWTMALLRTYSKQME